MRPFPFRPLRPGSRPPRARRVGAASTLAGVLITSPFVRMLAVEAVEASGLKLRSLTEPEAADRALRVLVAGLDELGPHAADHVVRLRQAGVDVVVLVRAGQDRATRALTALGAVAGERAVLLGTLPELLREIAARGPAD